MCKSKSPASLEDVGSVNVDSFALIFESGIGCLLMTFRLDWCFSTLN